MHIKHIEIGNFRKLSAVRIDFSEKYTVFVGANNSGKTSAMTALQKFLGKSKKFSIHDFTLGHWPKINQAGAAWEASAAKDEKPEDFDWGDWLPFLDVWFSVEKHELHRVQKILPTLDWNDEPIGVRLCFGPKDAKAREMFRQEFLIARSAVTAILAHSLNVTHNPDKAVDGIKPGRPFTLWPDSMMAFLDGKLNSVFSINTYLLDPAKLVDPKKDWHNHNSYP